MDDQSVKLQQQAITAALSAQWEDAIQLNQQLIDLNPNDVDALNRVARAYFELGNLSDSRKFYSQSLKTDPYNQIAAKFLKRIEAFDKKGTKPVHNGSHHVNCLDTDLFIEEPGKTKVVNLLKVAEPQKLSLLSSGCEVVLVPKGRGITVTDPYGEYVGVLPDDVSHQLDRLIKGGNKYKAFIKTIKTNGLTILIRETLRSAKFKNQPSFLDSMNAMTYSSDHITLIDDDAVVEDDAEEDSGNS